MSYQTILTAIKNKLESVGAVRRVLDYAPSSVHETPLIYVLFESATIERTGPVTETTYNVTANLVVRFQDNERAEREIIPLIDEIPALFAADPQLGGVLTSGIARVSEINSGDLVTIGSVEYRLVQFVISVREKGVL